MIQRNDDGPIKRISGRGTVVVEGEEVGKVQYTLIVTEDVTFVPAEGESASEKHVSGEIALVERSGETPRKLDEFVDGELDLHLDDGTMLKVLITDRIPGGYLVEAQGDFQEMS